MFVVAALMALTACSVPAENPLSTASVVASGGPDATEIEEARELRASQDAEAEPTITTSGPTKSEKEAAYLLGARQALPAYGFTESEFGKEQIMAEGRKICEQGDAYKGHPKLNKVAGATGALEFHAKSNLC